MVPQSNSQSNADYLLESLRRSLSQNDLMRCSLCSKFFEDPVVLNCCSHRCCRRCLNEYNRLQGQKCPNCERLFNGDSSFSTDKAFSLALRMVRLNGTEPLSTQKASINIDLNAQSTETFNIVLWPDSSLYDSPLPSCAKRPRYIQVPENTTVAHLIEYLFVRIEVEGNVRNIRKKYKLQLTNVIKEQENVRREDLPRTASFLHRSTETHSTAAHSIESHSMEEPEELPPQNLMIAIKHPFRALDSKLTVQELFDQFWIDTSRPLKLVYVFSMP